MSTDPSGVDPCPRCGVTSGVKVITGTNPRPQLFLDRLTATVVLRQVIALEEQAPGLSDDQLWARLADLARGSPGAAVTVTRRTDETPDRPLVERYPRLGSRRPVGPRSSAPHDPGWLPVERGSWWPARTATFRCADLAGRVNRG